MPNPEVPMPSNTVQNNGPGDEGVRLEEMPAPDPWDKVATVGGTGKVVEALLTNAVNGLTKTINLESKHEAAVAGDCVRLNVKQKELDNHLKNAAFPGLHADARAAVEMNARKLADEEYRVFGNDVKSNSSANRTEMLRQAAEENARAGAVDELLGSSPRSLLSFHGLGEPERFRMGIAVERAGNAELTTFARIAVFTGNLALGAEVLARLEKIPTLKRPFSADNFAEKLAGKRWRELKTAAKQTRENYRRMAAREQAHNSGKKDPYEKVKRGLHDKTLADSLAKQAEQERQAANRPNDYGV